MHHEIISIEEWDRLPLSQQICFQPTKDFKAFERWTTLEKLMKPVGSNVYDVDDDSDTFDSLNEVSGYPAPPKEKIRGRRAKAKQKGTT